MPYLQEPLNMPEPEDSSAKEVFAFCGLCLYQVQLLEQGLINLTTVLRSKDMTRVTVGDILSAYEKSDRKTLGQLLFDVRKYVAVPPEVDVHLSEGLRLRNDFAHSFFRRHDVDFLSDTGRKKMIQELQDVIRFLHKTDGLVSKIQEPLWKKLGVTEAALNRLFDAAVNAEKAKDAAG